MITFFQNCALTGYYVGPKAGVFKLFFKIAHQPLILFNFVENRKEIFGSMSVTLFAF